MVGTQRPKSTPATVEAWTPPVLAAVVAEAAALLEATVLLAMALAVATDEAACVNMVDVTVTVAGQTSTAAVVVVAAAEEITAMGSDVAVLIAADETAAPPAAAWPVKFVKPFAVRRSATLIPTATSGVLAVLADRLLATTAPTTAGSMRGVMPRRISVAGRVGSLQMVGML